MNQSIKGNSEMGTDKENEKEWKDAEDLAKGWKKKSVPRKRSERVDHYYRSPEGQVLKSMTEVKKVLGSIKNEKTKISPIKAIEKLDKRQSCSSPLSPKYVEAFHNFLEKRSKSSRKEEKEMAIEKEKMCNLKRKWAKELREKENAKIKAAIQKTTDDTEKDNQVQVKDKKEEPKDIVNESKSISEKEKKKGTNDSNSNNEAEEKLIKKGRKSLIENATQSRNEKEGLGNKPNVNKNKSIFEKAKRKKTNNSDMDNELEEEPSKRRKLEAEKVKKNEVKVPKSNQKKLTIKNSNEKQTKKTDLDTESDSEAENEQKKSGNKKKKRNKGMDKVCLAKKCKEKKTKKTNLDTESELEEGNELKKTGSEKKSNDKNCLKESPDKTNSKVRKESVKKDKMEDEDLEKQSEGKLNKKKSTLEKRKKKKNQEEEEEESDKDIRKNESDKGKVESKSEKTKKNKRKSDYDFATDSECEEEVEEQKKLMAELRQFFKDNNIQLKPRAPTRGDGNCFFRSIADQIVLHKISDKPTTHRDLRLAVCNHIKNLPPHVLQSTVDIVYKGKRRGLADLAHRQRKLGQFVDDNGIMVMSTALFLARNILVYSAHAQGNQGQSVTPIDGGEEAENQPPLTIFYFKDYQHYQSVGATGKITKTN